MDQLDEKKIEEYNEILKIYNQKLMIDNNRIKLHNIRTSLVIARGGRQDVVQPILNYHESTGKQDPTQ